MVDYREEVLKSIQNVLVSKDYSRETIRDITDAIVINLWDYDLARRTTQVAERDLSSEKLIKAFVCTLLTEGKSKNSAYMYQKLLQRLAMDSPVPIVELTTFDIIGWLAIAETKASLRTCENYRSYLASFYKWLKKERIIAENPMENINPIKYMEEIKIPFSDIEIEKLRNSCGNLRERAELELLLSSGVRVSELSAMNINDINFNTMEVIVKKGKGNKQRITYINEICSKYLKDYLSSREDVDECLFRTRLGKRVSTDSVEADIKRIGMRANVEDSHPHRCRHTFATKLAKKGMDIKSIQMLMGHVSVNTTMKYISYSDSYIRQEYYRFN